VVVVVVGGGITATAITTVLTAEPTEQSDLFPAVLLQMAVSWAVCQSR
jgi:hypothetical protein